LFHGRRRLKRFLQRYLPPGAGFLYLQKRSVMTETTSVYFDTRGRTDALKLHACQAHLRWCAVRPLCTRSGHHPLQFGNNLLGRMVACPSAHHDESSYCPYDRISASRANSYPENAQEGRGLWLEAEDGLQAHCQSSVLRWPVDHRSGDSQSNETRWP
jgi:hypothetical protein